MLHSYDIKLGWEDKNSRMCGVTWIELSVHALACDEPHSYNTDLDGKKKKYA